MERHVGQAAGYHKPDATAERLDALIDVENYAARRDREARRQARKHHCSRDRIMAINRVREIKRWFDHSYGITLLDDDGGRDDLALLINYLVQVNLSDPIGAAAREVRAWAPWLSELEARRMAEHAISHPIRLKADTLAERLGITNELRSLLGFKTIGACDLNRAQRKEAARKRRNQAECQRRRNNGVMPRDQYEARARAMRAEAEALGIAYEALRKRRQRALSAPVSQVRDERTLDTQRLPQTWDKEAKVLPIPGPSICRTSV